MTDERRLVSLRQKVMALPTMEVGGATVVARTQVFTAINEVELAALPQPATEPALDVDALIRAMYARLPYTNWTLDAEGNARAVAAEYARLAAQPSAEVERLRAAAQAVIEADRETPGISVAWYVAIKNLRAALAGSDR